jgi:hypothetical protein
MDYFIYAKVRNFAKFLSFSRTGEHAVVVTNAHCTNLLAHFLMSNVCYYTDKKKTKFSSNVRKVIWERLQSHI